jgi:RNA polymerase sigma factor (sigma-70 family)
LAAVPSIGPASRAGVDAHALYERQYPLVLRFCRSKLRTREDAEDAAQTTFFHALGSLRQGTVPTTEAAWLLTIARNVCLNRWDASRRRSRVEVARDPHVLQAVAPGREDSDVDLIGLQDALGRLTEPQRRAILLREWQGLSYAEIATELELTESAVETLLFRARRSLARELQGGRSLRDLGSLLGGLKSLLGGAGALKLAAGVAAVVAVGIAAVPQLQQTQARRPAGGPAEVTRPAKTEAPTATSSLTRAGTTPPARQGGRSSSHSPVTASAPVAPAASGPATAPGSSPSSPGPTSSEPPAPGATPQAPANESTPATPDPHVPQLPTVEAPSLPSLPAVPLLPVTPTVTVPSIPALPTVDPPVVTVPLPKLP